MIFKFGAIAQYFPKVTLECVEATTLGGDANKVPFPEIKCSLFVIYTYK